MRIQFAPRLFAALVASALLAACGGNLSSGGAIPAGTSGAQSAQRSIDAASVATPSPTPRPPCYCPPRQRICSDIACLTTNGTERADALAPAAATPSPTPHPPCYCPPSRIPHACPDCVVTSVSIPGANASDRLAAAFAPRSRRTPATA